MFLDDFEEVMSDALAFVGLSSLPENYPNYFNLDNLN